MIAAHLKLLAKTIVLILMLFAGLQDTAGSLYWPGGDRQYAISSEVMGDQILLDWAVSDAAVNSEMKSEMKDGLNLHRTLMSHEDDICHFHCAGSFAASSWMLPPERIWHPMDLISIHSIDFFTSALPDALYKPPIV